MAKKYTVRMCVGKMSNWLSPFIGKELKKSLLWINGEVVTSSSIVIIKVTNRIHYQSPWSGGVMELAMPFPPSMGLIDGGV